MFRRPRLVRPRPDGRYDLKIDVEQRRFLARLAGELRDLVTDDEPGTERLFPSPYPDDPERDAGWHAVVRHELVEAHLAAITTVERTAELSVIDEGELAQWMTAMNALRLVLAERLGIDDEHDDVDPGRPDDPRAPAFNLYHHLGFVLDEIVRARSERL